MTYTNIQHIFFDLDHTLWDFDKNSALTFKSIFEEEKLEVALEEFLEAYIPINNNYWELYRKNLISKEDLRTGRLKDCFASLQFEIPAQTLENLSNNYIRFLPQNNILLENTKEILEYLKQKYQLHIITNGFEEVQHLKLKNSNISQYFSTVTTSEEAGVKKPELKIFEMALVKAKTTAGRSLMIGDNFEADILGAQAAGMECIYFNYYQKSGSFEIKTIQKLKELMFYL